MRHIERLIIPRILEEKHEEWQRKYEEKLRSNPKARPDSSKYAHKDIRSQLMSMSHCKCFYCEGPLTDKPKEVDHYIEVAVDHSKAFDWDNLYLGCTNCNDKIPHDSIPVTEALDPCRDSDEVIRENLTFRDEVIRAVGGSLRGTKTIQKFRLDTELLDAQRAKWLNKVNAEIMGILEAMVMEGRKELTEAELNLLKEFMHPTSPFSLMSEIYIKKALQRFVAFD